jgi:hypothetical protein
MPLPPRRGLDAIRTRASATSSTLSNIHIVTVDCLVRDSGPKVAVPGAAVMVIRDKKIVEWRDYVESVETARRSGLAGKLSRLLGRWCKPLAVHDPGRIVVDMAIAVRAGPGTPTRRWPRSLRPGRRPERVWQHARAPRAGRASGDRHGRQPGHRALGQEDSTRLDAHTGFIQCPPPSTVSVAGAAGGDAAARQGRGRTPRPIMSRYPTPDWRSSRHHTGPVTTLRRSRSWWAPTPPGNEGLRRAPVQGWGGVLGRASLAHFDDSARPG